MKASVSRRKSGATARFSSSSVNAMLLLVIVGFLRLVIVSQLQLYRRPTVASPTCLIYTTSWDITLLAGDTTRDDPLPTGAIRPCLAWALPAICTQPCPGSVPGALGRVCFQDRRSTSL